MNRPYNRDYQGNGQPADSFIVSPAAFQSKDAIKSSGLSPGRGSPSRNGLDNSASGALTSRRFLILFGVAATALIAIWFLINDQRMLLCTGQTDVQLDYARKLVHCEKFQNRKLALVVPFLQWDGQKVEDWIAYFDKMRPCSLSCGPPQTDLVMYFNRRINDHPELKQNITKAFDASQNGPRCFKQLLFKESDLTDYEDYRKGLIHRGPRNMFFKAFDLMAGKYDFYFQNEPDIESIRPDWLDALINDTLGNHFWIRGTVHKKRMDRLKKSPPEYWAHRMHLNGAALYNLNDERFTKGFMGRIRAIPDEGPFDFAIENYTSDPANWEYMMDNLPYFQYTDVVQNVINDNTTREIILATFPDTYLVHGLGRKPGHCPSCARKDAAEKAAKEKAAKEKAAKDKAAADKKKS